MPKLIIDNKEVEFTQGQTVIEAAKASGIEIPHFCWHPGLSVSGNCRICLVEIEKLPKLAIACSTTATDGMVVHTKSEKVVSSQKAVMEFLLINHPLDCPICDEAGECKPPCDVFDVGIEAAIFMHNENDGPPNNGPDGADKQTSAFSVALGRRKGDAFTGHTRVGFGNLGSQRVAWAEQI